MLKKDAELLESGFDHVTERTGVEICCEREA